MSRQHADDVCSRGVGMFKGRLRLPDEPRVDVCVEFLHVRPQNRLPIKLQQRSSGREAKAAQERRKRTCLSLGMGVVISSPAPKNSATSAMKPGGSIRHSCKTRLAAGCCARTSTCGGSTARQGPQVAPVKIKGDALSSILSTT